MLDGDRTLQVWSPTWITTGLSSPWVNYGVIYEGFGYYKDLQGIVYLRGLIAGPGSTPVAVGSTICVLPVGYRPKFRHIYNQVGDGNPSGSHVVSRIDIDNTGIVNLQAILSGDTGVVWQSLAGISFSTY